MKMRIIAPISISEQNGPNQMFAFLFAKIRQWEKIHKFKPDFEIEICECPDA